MTKFLNFVQRVVASTDAIKSCQPRTIVELGGKVEGIVVEKVKVIFAHFFRFLLLLCPRVFDLL